MEGCWAEAELDRTYRTNRADRNGRTARPAGSAARGWMARTGGSETILADFTVEGAFPHPQHPRRLRAVAACLLQRQRDAVVFDFAPRGEAVFGGRGAGSYVIDTGDPVDTALEIVEITFQFGE